VPLPDQGQLVRREGVEGMPRLMQQSHHVFHQSHGIHEDERPAVEMEGLAIPAGCFPLAAFQVEQAFIDHGLELTPER
jgi:hypothetical protein